jgi:hypothetical protein
LSHRRRAGAPRNDRGIAAKERSQVRLYAVSPAGGYAMSIYRKASVKRLKLVITGPVTLSNRA